MISIVTTLTQERGRDLEFHLTQSLCSLLFLFLNLTVKCCKIQIIATVVIIYNCNAFIYSGVSIQVSKDYYKRWKLIQGNQR